jgi:DNA-binding transcriptional regulator LsrR (DeoR family)
MNCLLLQKNGTGQMVKAKPREQTPLLAAKVAYLKAKGFKQSEIAKRLHLTRPTVSRLLAPEGRAAHYLKVQLPTFDWDRVSNEDRRALRDMDEGDSASEKLTALLAAIAPSHVKIEAHVIPEVADADAPNNSSKPNPFFDSASRVVWNLLRSAKIIGFTWGRTLSLLLSSARRGQYTSPFEGQSEQPIVIPLCGESLATAKPTSLSSSTLAQGFGELLTNLPEQSCLSLGMIPIFFPGPTAFDDAELRAGRKLLSYSAAYREIFDGDGANATEKDPLAKRLDVVVTSISRVNCPFGFTDSNEFNWKILKLSKLEKLVMGDLGGVPLAKPNLSAKGQRELRELLRRWTGLQKDHIRGCVDRASARGSAAAGVIVVAIGADRVLTVLEAVRLGLVNRLVLDRPLSESLIEQLDKRSSRAL